MVGKDERKDAFVVPPEARDFVRKRDQKKCLLCGAGNTMPDPVLIVAGSPWDEIELEWLKERNLVPGTFSALNPQNIISLCPNHHELFLHRRWCFVPCPEDRHAMRVHEEHDMRDRDHRLALGHDVPPRTLPQLSGKFDFLNCAFGDEALSLTPAGGRMTLVSTMPPDHESALHLPRPPQYPLPGVNPYVILAHAAKCVGGPRKPIFPDIEHEIAELVYAYNRDPSLPLQSPPQSTMPHHHSPHESGSSHNSDSHSESRSSSPTSSLDAHPPPPMPASVPPASAPPRTRTFAKPAGPSPEQGYHPGYGISRQDTGQSHFSNNHYSAPGGTQPIPIFRPPSALATGNPGPVLDGSPSSGTGTGRESIPPPPPIPHHLQPPNHTQPIQPQMTGRRRPSDVGPPPINLQQQAPLPPPPIPPSSSQSFNQTPPGDRNVFAQQSASFPQYGQYPAGAPGPGAAASGAGPGLGRRPSKLRHSEDLRGGLNHLLRS
ncbi:HNH endonuclease [Ceratobasidium sp. AG-Ba]|nr:HNH endonuclease [Ceratobasidium sp. AG-Ba]